jgi:hypothetical protein
MSHNVSKRIAYTMRVSRILDACWTECAKLTKSQSNSESEDLSQTSQPVVDRRLTKEIVRAVVAQLQKRQRQPSRSEKNRKDTVVEDSDERKAQLVSCKFIAAKYCLTSLSQASVRRLFKDVFRISQDEDFVDHITAGRQDVHDYEHADGEGPNKNDLHFDMERSPTSPWNKAILAILTDHLIEEREEQPVHLRPQVRPKPYISKMLLDKFRRCQKYWKAGRPQRIANGIQESYEDIEARLNEDGEKSRKYTRHNTRRRSVRIMVFYRKSH